MPALSSSHSFRLGQRAPALVAGAWTETAVGALVGLVAGWAIVRAQPLVLLLALLPILAWLVLRPTVTAVLAGASLPLLTNVVGNRLGGSNVALSDLLLVFALGGIVLAAALGQSVPMISALRPVSIPVLQYGVFVLLLLPLHLGSTEILKTAQRYELFLVPLVVGAYVALRGVHIRVLQAFVLGAAVLAVIWPIHSFGMQKNPVGQMIANAILVLVGVKGTRRLLVCLPVLVLGLFLTQSRGALVAAAVGFGVLALVSLARPGGFLARRGIALVAVAVVAFAFMPASIKDRVTSISSSPNAPGSYALQVRQQYSRDAQTLISAHPWTGIGVGNYLAGNPYNLTQTTDPHDIVLLEAAEGGYGFAASFLVLVLGTLAVLWRLGRRVEIAVVAAAVVIATTLHGLVDVYWVRGTPVLGWLLVGMACGCALSRGRPEAEP